MLLGEALGDVQAMGFGAAGDPRSEAVYDAGELHSGVPATRFLSLAFSIASSSTQAISTRFSRC